MAVLTNARVDEFLGPSLLRGSEGLGETVALHVTVPDVAKEVPKWLPIPTLADV